VRFADSNVLLYAVSRDAGEHDKAERARQILASRDLAISTQVLQEFYVQATRASRPDALSHDQARKLVESFMRFTVADTTPRLALAAIAAHHRFHISYWDAAILEAARSLGCKTVLSEGLNEGHDYGGVVVQDPFRD
jgi:predicted nucleic acid-binding protein